MSQGRRRRFRRPRTGEGRRLARRAAWARSALLLLAGFACAFAGMQAVNLYRRLQAPPPAPTIPFGVNDYGRPVDDEAAIVRVTDAPATGSASPQPEAVASVPAEPDGLALRDGCAWGNPGRNPYRGTVEQALRRARLPEDVVAQLNRRIAARQVSDEVEITNDGIRTRRGDGYYDPRAFSMTFGKTLCRNTRVNFKPGHLERADLYQVSDAAGNSYSVMVPYVCGNVSVLGARAERIPRSPAGQVLAAASGMPAAGLAGPAARRQLAPIAGPGGLASTAGGGGGGGGGGGNGTNTVPEPQTWSILLAGVGLVAWFRRRARGGRE